MKLVFGLAFLASVFVGLPVFDDAPKVVNADAVRGTHEAPGYDISWPQCGKQYPPGQVAFAIIGINGGRPYTSNPCFMHQYRWAQRIERNPAVYVNTASPKADQTQAVNGPWGQCQPEDGWCRGYNFGYGLAAEVVERARSLNISPSMYWLDVETGNYWSSDQYNNSQVIRGAVDYFKERHLPVGIYGTPYQFRLIAGGWTSPGIPIWTAGAQGHEAARNRCSPGYAFAGGTVVMTQYYDYGYDTNYICPGAERLMPMPVHYTPEIGPPRRSTAPDGAVLPHWQVVPLVAN